MDAVILDAATLDSEDLDFGPINAAVDSLVCYPHTQAKDVVSRLEGVHIALVNKVVLEASLLAQLPHLKHIIVLATGVNNIDLKAAKELGISVQNCRAYGVDSVAQHCLMLMLTLSTRMLSYRRAISNGDWSKSPQFCMLDYPVESLAGKTLGIVGYGDLGKGVADLALAFGMTVLIAQRQGQGQDQGLKHSLERMPLAQMLPQVDILSLHCPLTEDTTDLIDWPQLCALPNTALLINCARGGIVNEAALLKALDEGQIAGAGIDVLTQEPPPIDHPLLAVIRDNLIITPHTAWASRQARQTILDQAKENIMSLELDQNPIRAL